MKKFISVLILVIPSFVLGAAWSDPYKIIRIQVYGNSDRILVFTEGGSVYTPGCKANQWEIKATDDEGRERVYSLLLAAYMSNKSVAFWYEDTCGEWDYHVSHVVNIRN